MVQYRLFGCGNFDENSFGVIKALSNNKYTYIEHKNPFNIYYSIIKTTIVQLNNDDFLKIQLCRLLRHTKLFHYGKVGVYN